MSDNNNSVNSQKVIKPSFGVYTEPKLVTDFGRGLIAIFLSFAAFSFAVKGFITIDKTNEYYLPVFLLFASLNILLAARTIDWLLDRINVKSWEAICNSSTPKKFEDFFHYFYKWDGAYFRMRMFGGAYFVLTIMISLITSFSVYYGIKHLQGMGILFSISNSLGLHTEFKFIISVFLFVYIIYQMLTIESKGSRYLFVGSVSILSFLIAERIILG